MKTPIGRRGILGLLAGGVGAMAANPRIPLKDMAGAMGLPPSASVGDIANNAPSPGDPTPWSAMTRAERLSRVLNYRIEVEGAARAAAARPEHHPAHIASKRSWSATYKASAAAQEAAMVAAFEWRRWREDNFMDILAEKLGLNVDD